MTALREDASNWSRADMLRDAAEVRADYADMVADQMRAAAWEASEDYIDDRPTRAEIEAEEAADEWWRDR